MANRQKLALNILKFLPRSHMSRASGVAARIPVPRPIRNRLYGRVSKMLQIDIDRAELPANEYRSVNALFARRLRPELHTIADIPEGLISPAEGYLTTSGAIEDGAVLQAKGMSYSVADLLGGELEAAPFNHGGYATIYLTPKNYHRVHAPLAGHVTSAKLFPGTLYPVYPVATESVQNLYVRNERLVIDIASNFGPVAVVLVGASNVGSITTAFDPMIRSNKTFKMIRRRNFAYDAPISVDVGDELATFNLGSTVVVLWSDSHWKMALQEGDEVKMGQALASPVG